MISCYELATPETLDPEAYFFANPDVAQASSGDLSKAREHLDTFGIAEGRTQFSRSALRQIVDSRRHKIADFCPSLGQYSMHVLGVPLEMARVADPGLPVPFDRVSSHEYDEQTVDFVDSDPTRTFLDLGSGMRPTYRQNVVYAEIAALPTTDVLCFAESLPFDASAFDGAICLSVLEHVPDPFRAAAELLRVIRLGGQLIVDWPFLQPVHGFPNHYYNATESGARNAFERLGAEVTSLVPPWLHPVFTLRWFLDEWQRALPGSEQQAFLDLTVGDILSEPESALLERSWAETLPESQRAAISAGTRLIVTKH